MFVCRIEGFLIKCLKTKAKLLWSIIRTQIIQHSNQNWKQIDVVSMKSPENMHEQVTIGFGFTSDWSSLVYFCFLFHNSVRWKILLGFLCRNRLLLTGTPIQNSMAEVCDSSYIIQWAVFFLFNRVSWIDSLQLVCFHSKGYTVNVRYWLFVII